MASKRTSKERTKKKSPRTSTRTKRASSKKSSRTSTGKKRTSRKLRYGVGDLFTVPLGEHTYAFGRIVYADERRGACVQFFRETSDKPEPPPTVLESGILFGPIRVGGIVQFERGRWPIVGRDPDFVPPDPRAYVFWSSPLPERGYELRSMAGGNTRFGATKEQTIGLERDGFQHPEGIENRIRESMGMPTGSDEPEIQEPSGEFSPFRLFEGEQGRFSLMLTDEHMVDVMDVFEAEGREGNGYDWTGVARQVVRLHPELTKKLEMDPEAGTFVAHGRDRAALEALGQELCGAFHDRERLRELIRGADRE